MSGKTRSVRSRIYTDSQETEFRTEKSGARAADKQRRGDHVYPWDWAQSAGALDRAGARRPCQGSAGRSLSRDSRHARRGRSRKSQAGALEIRREAAQSGPKVAAKASREKL